MSPKVLINENHNPFEPGAVDVYASYEQAESKLEDWYVDVPHCILSEDGTVLELSNCGQGVHIAEKIPIEKRPELLRSFLIYHVRSIASVQGWESLGIDECQLETVSAGELWHAALMFD